MKCDTYFPTERLKPFIRHLVVSENEQGSAYRVFPSTGLVAGFQYRGQLSILSGNIETRLATAGITGISDTYKQFKNAPGTGTILVYFTEVGFAHFASCPVNELHNLSLSLADIFGEEVINEVQEKLSFAVTDSSRIRIVEQFLEAQLNDIPTDQLVLEAVKRMYQSKGTIRIKELNEQLYISQSPFEKRFRKMVGTTPKKFASIVRFNAVLEELGSNKSLTEICYENHFFDQAHFIKSFRQFTGDTPENLKRRIEF